MGQYASSHAGLPKERIELSGDDTASLLGMNTYDDLKRVFTNPNSKFQKLASNPSKFSQAEKVKMAKVAVVTMEIEEIPKIVSFGDVVRPISSGFVARLSQSFYRGGLIVEEGSPGLTVCVELAQDPAQVRKFVV